MQLLRKMLDQRVQRWEEFKKECEERLVELSDVYSGRKPLMRIEKNGAYYSLHNVLYSTVVIPSVQLARCLYPAIVNEETT